VQILLRTDRILGREKVSANLEEVLSVLLQAFNKPLLQHHKCSDLRAKQTLNFN